MSDLYGAWSEVFSRIADDLRLKSIRCRTLSFLNVNGRRRLEQFAKKIQTFYQTLKCHQTMPPQPASSVREQLSMIRYNYVLVACARWEADSISEWIVYHRQIGFDHLYLYCNDDDPTALYEAVLPFTDFVDFMHFGLQGHQQYMYMDFLKTHAKNCERFIFLDIDEFLLLRHHHNISDFVKSFDVEPDAIHFNSLNAGHNGHLTRPAGLALRNFNRRADHASAFTKSVARSEALDESRFLFALGGAWWHNIDIILRPDAHIVNVLNEDMKLYYMDINKNWGNMNSPEFQKSLIDTAFVYHIGVKSEHDLIRRYNRGLGGQFHGQSVWRDIALQNRDIVLDHLNKHNVVEETRLIEVWDAMMRGAWEKQIVPSPIGPNLAIGATALQSSTSEWSRHQDPALDAAGAIDGKASGSHHHHTDLEFEPWWQVDLGAPTQIRELRIFNRVDGVRDRLRNFIVLGSLDGDNWAKIFEKLDGLPFGGVDGMPYIWSPADGVGINYRFVRVRGIGVSLLDFDQIEVY